MLQFEDVYSFFGKSEKYVKNSDFIKANLCEIIKRKTEIKKSFLYLPELKDASAEALSTIGNVINVFFRYCEELNKSLQPKIFKPPNIGFTVKIFKTSKFLEVFSCKKI